MHKSYRIQKGCIRCKHALEIYEHDEESEFYCTLNAKGVRPLSGSCAMGESFDFQDDQWGEQSDAWDAWAKDKRVNHRGICDKFEDIKEIIT